MTIKLSSLAADVSKERSGDWVEPKEWPGLNPDKPFEAVPLPGLSFHVRSTLFPPFVTARQAEIERLKKLYPEDDVPAEEMARIEGELAVEHLLLGWRGLDVDYSREMVSTILSAEEHRVLRSMIYWCAGRVGKRAVEFVESGTKN